MAHGGTLAAAEETCWWKQPSVGGVKRTNCALMVPDGVYQLKLTYSHLSHLRGRRAVWFNNHTFNEEHDYCEGYYLSPGYSLVWRWYSTPTKNVTSCSASPWQNGYHLWRLKDQSSKFNSRPILSNTECHDADTHKLKKLNGLIEKRKNTSSSDIF